MLAVQGASSTVTATSVPTRSTTVALPGTAPVRTSGPLMSMRSATGMPGALAGLPDTRDHGGMIGVIAVRHVESGDIHARVEQLNEHLDVLGGWSERADDLCLSHDV